MYTEKTSSIEFKTELLSEIVNDWNRIQGTNFTIEPATYGVRIIFGHKRGGAHGALLSEIGGLAAAFSWSWAVYYDLEIGMYISI